MNTFLDYFSSHKLYTYTAPRWSDMTEWLTWQASPFDSQQCFIYEDYGEHVVVMFDNGSMMNACRSHLS